MTQVKGQNSEQNLASNEQLKQAEILDMNDVYLCNPPRGIVYPDGAAGTVIAEMIDDELSSKPVAVITTEHGYVKAYWKEERSDFSHHYTGEYYRYPATRIKAQAMNKIIREHMVTKRLPFYEWRIRRAQKKVGETLLKTLGIN